MSKGAYTPLEMFLLFSLPAKKNGMVVEKHAIAEELHLDLDH